MNSQQNKETHQKPNTLIPDLCTHNGPILLQQQPILTPTPDQHTPYGPTLNQLKKIPFGLKNSNFSQKKFKLIMDPNLSTEL